MKLHLLLVVAILGASACSRHSFGHSSGSGSRSFNGGSVHFSYHRYGQEGGTGLCTMQLNQDHTLDDRVFRLFVFQDLDGNSAYSPQIDRRLAEDIGMIRIDDQQGQLPATSFGFRAVHEPIGLHYRIEDKQGQLIYAFDEVL